ncbi:hypothetical protein D9613_001571 [Agrocybe pediades]|uniref:FYVE-type domain-containing protein n=1 Tax=Agrocybe pediades TaxID=84607 RepID=A0A8H4VXC4_9AGAR|nr:hypothetical protein D9613_001571 [Agrocybe pediades]
MRTPSLNTDSSPSSSSSSIIDHPNINDRPNEHLAVLLDKHLWKPDSSATVCDNFYCRTTFGLFERKHHCRKCGGVFCHSCTSRTTPLLDASHLSFLQPPRNVPLSAFESPISPIIRSRVCDDCWDQIHGCPTTPHTPEVNRNTLKRVLNNPISMLIFPSSPPMSSPSTISSPSSVSSGSADSSDLAIPPSLKRRSIRSTRNSSSASSVTTCSSDGKRPSSKPDTVRALRQPLPQQPIPTERSFGDLDAYPLRQASAICKASGGGRWEPKPSPVFDGQRPPIPGAKAPFEIQMEQEEMLERQRRANPVVRDGEFQYRFPKEPEPIIMSRSLDNLSTF